MLPVGALVTRPSLPPHGHGQLWARILPLLGSVQAEQAAALGVSQAVISELLRPRRAHSGPANWTLALAAACSEVLPQDQLAQLSRRALELAADPGKIGEAAPARDHWRELAIHLMGSVDREALEVNLHEQEEAGAPADLLRELGAAIREVDDHAAVPADLVKSVRRQLDKRRRAR